jgi:hypothetical protein
MSNPRVPTTTQIRRARRRMLRARIARMTLSEQMSFACDLWRVERILIRKSK